MKTQEVVKTLMEFIPAFGRWFWAVAFNFILALTGAFLDITGTTKFPSGLWQTLLVVGVIVAALIPFHTLRMQRDKLKSEHQREDILLNLALKRAEGVSIRNRGIRLGGPSEVAGWIEETETWKEETKEEIRKLSPTEEELFETMGDIPVRVYQNVHSGEHQRYLNFMNLRLERLVNAILRLRYRPTESI